MPRPTVLLFDIDGTIITTGGAARAALETAIGSLCQVETFQAEFGFGGMTDYAIMRRALQQLGKPDHDEAIEEAIQHYLARLEPAIDQAEHYLVQPGVVDVLQLAAQQDHIALGLGTGNVERGARIKLARIELNHFFDFGGFGCDHEERAQLILRGAQRGAERLAQPLEQCRVVIIGDTVRDVNAAHDNGFECVAVCTGGVARDVLEDAGADWCFETLAEPGAFDAILHGRAA